MLLNPFYEPSTRNDENDFDDVEEGVNGGLPESLMTFKLKLDELVGYYEG